MNVPEMTVGGEKPVDTTVFYEGRKMEYDKTTRSTKRLLGSSAWKMPVLSNAAVTITRAKQPLRKWRRSENPCETTCLDPAACNFPGFVLHLYYFTRKALCAKRSSNEILMIMV